MRLSTYFRHKVHTRLVVYAANTPSKAYDLQYAVRLYRYAVARGPRYRLPLSFMWPQFTLDASKKAYDLPGRLCQHTGDRGRPPRRRTLTFHRVKAKTPAHATRGGTRQSVFILVSVTIEHALYNKEDPINHYWAVWNMKACAARAIM